MAHTYKIKEGHGNRVFINTVRNADGTITSQTPLESPYLEAVEQTAPASNHVAGVAPQNEQPAQPVQSTAPQEQQPQNKVEEQ